MNNLQTKTLSKLKLLQIKNLLQKKHREKEGKFIVEGWKSVREAANAGMQIETVLYDERRIEDTALLLLLERTSKEIYSVKAKEIESISDTVTSQGIVAVAKKVDSSALRSSILKKSSALIVVLDSINDPGNLGTIIRMCDWFGIDALMVGKNSVELYNPKVVRATMGSLFHFPIFDDVDLATVLMQYRREKYSIYSTELSGSDDLRKISFFKKSVIVIGSESHGVSKKISILTEKQIRIPKFGKAESLNAAMACGIILSHIRLK